MATAADRLTRLQMDEIYGPFYRTFMVSGEVPRKKFRRRDRMREIIRTLEDWDPRLVVPCHGEVTSGLSEMAEFGKAKEAFL